MSTVDDITSATRQPLVKPVYAELSPTEELLAGTENPGGVGKSRPYITLYCHHQNDSGFKMGSDESRSNV